MPKTRVKICCISSQEEAQLAIRHGASALGLVSAMPSGPGVIDEALIAQIARRMPPAVASVLLTSQQNAAGIIQQQRDCRVNTLQLCDALPLSEYALLHEQLPGITLIQVIHVSDETAIDEALTVSKYVHGLLLDSGNPNAATKSLGGTGNTHNWDISQEIVSRVDVPVFLAGGLRPDNVQEAIRKIKPFGVDICTGVRSGEDFVLEPEKLAAFFAAVE